MVLKHNGQATYRTYMVYNHTIVKTYAFKTLCIFYHMSPKHLHRYINEFSFRHNTAQSGTMAFIDMTIEKMLNRRLTYKELINVPA